ncbi:MAG: ATP-binding cassette domain-containing protein [Treponema sp.]|nr:ATP-binding cassette domain-containing protein [Treponema sp.]
MTALKKFFRPENRFMLIGSLLLFAIVTVSVLAPLIAPHSPYARSGLPFEKPNAAHPLGCNDVGNDLLSELMYGGRISLTVGVFAAFYATLVATLLALIAGYFGGALDRVLMRIVDVIMALPFMPLVIVLGVFLGPGIGTQILVITVVMWAHPCRELRSHVLKTRSNGYIDAARAMGEKPYRIIVRHTLHDIIPLIVPQFVSVAQSAILIESSLSFLGLGDPVSKSWGSMLYFANTRAAFLTGAWVYWVLPPGLCIALTCLSFSLLGFSFGGRRGLEYFPYGSFTRPVEKTTSTGPKDIPLATAHLDVTYQSNAENMHALFDVSLKLARGEVVGIVGESGSGKTTLAMTILGLLKYPAAVHTGSVFINGTDVLGWTSVKMLQLRGKTIAYVPQNAMNTLNPVMTVRRQLTEAIRVHQKLSRKAEAQKVAQLLDWVHIPRDRARAYNHELSGGMKQRVVIAMALANNPDILIADEPTTGLDVLVQKNILDVLMQLKDKLSLSLVLITHDLPLATQYSDRLAVIYEGKIVDEGTVQTVAEHPKHEYTVQLFNNFPRLNQKKMWSRPQAPATESALVVQGLSKTFHSRQCLLKKSQAIVRAVDDVSFTVHPGEVLGIIGSSGSGKTTVSRIIMGLEKQDTGTITVNATALHTLKGQAHRKALRAIHLVFQDPYQSMRNSMRVFDVVAEPLYIVGERSQSVIAEKVCAALRDVYLPDTSEFLHRTPAQLSGGQRQRLSFARAVVSRPQYIIADEPTSMLDVSLRQEILRLMESLRSEYGIGFIFITHDLSLAYHFCDRILVMKNGVVVEQAEADALIHSPRHEYTKELIAAVDASCPIAASL